jgi:hypothetical protein
MQRTVIGFLLGVGLWVMGADDVQAEARRHTSHHPRAHFSEDDDRHSYNPSRKELPFEVLRMLSTGMTKAEVLSRAGRPRHEFKNRGTQRWVYSSADRWVVEIIFSGNHVIAIDWSRS